MILRSTSILEKHICLFRSSSLLTRECANEASSARTAICLRRRAASRRSENPSLYTPLATGCGSWWTGIQRCSMLVIPIGGLYLAPRLTNRRGIRAQPDDHKCRRRSGSRGLRLRSQRRCLVRHPILNSALFRWQRQQMNENWTLQSCQHAGQSGRVAEASGVCMAPPLHSKTPSAITPYDCERAP